MVATIFARVTNFGQINFIFLCVLEIGWHGLASVKSIVLLESLVSVKRSVDPLKQTKVIDSAQIPVAS